jgi:hypothetical protein
MTSTWDEHWAEAKRADMVKLAHRLGARLKHSGPSWIGPCPSGCAHKDGFIVNKDKGFLCRPSGARGDAVDMVMHVKGFTDVADALEYITGEKPPRKEDAQEQKPAQAPPPVEWPAVERNVEKSEPYLTTTKDALKLWREGVDPRGTSVERYLTQERRLDLPADLANEVLRWHPRIGAMLTLYRNVLTGQPQAVQRTFLDPDARKIGRKFTGPSGGAAAMLDPFDEVLDGLHVGEGVETCMTGRYWGLKPAWALGSTNGIGKFPILGGVESLTLLQENNGPSQRACEACAMRWHEAGREVIINTANHGDDLNDAIKCIGASP